MRGIKVTYDYSLKEALSLIDEWDDAWEIGQESNQTSLYNMMSNTFDNLSSDDKTKKAESNYLWIHYIAPMYMNESCVRTNEELIYESLDASKIKEFLRTVLYIFNTTYDEFKERIDYWQNAKGELLKKIETFSVNRFNDTPQNGGDFSDDSYTSTYSKNEVSSDRDTLVARLKEIDNGLIDVYDSWLKEFKGLFLY